MANGQAPDLSLLRPAGFQAAPLAAEEPRERPVRVDRPAPDRATRSTSSIQDQRKTRLRVPNDQLTGGGNYRPVVQVAEARERFLQLYAERGTMVECCRLAGLSYNAVQHAIERDPDFKARYIEAEQAVLEKLEREAMRRAVEGTVIRSRKFWHGELVGEDVRTEYSDNLLMLLLRAKAPERYRDNSLITINQVIKAVEGFDPREVLGQLPPPDEAKVTIEVTPQLVASQPESDS